MEAPKGSRRAGLKALYAALAVVDLEPPNLPTTALPKALLSPAEACILRSPGYTLEQWGSAQAITYIDEFEKIAKLLAENPESGTERPEFFDGLRSFPFNSHSLYFIKQADGITIIRILHQRMDPAGQVHKKFEP